MIQLKVKDPLGSNCRNRDCERLLQYVERSENCRLRWSWYWFICPCRASRSSPNFFNIVLCLTQMPHCLCWVSGRTANFCAKLELHTWSNSCWEIGCLGVSPRKLTTTSQEKTNQQQHHNFKLVTWEKSFNDMVLPGWRDWRSWRYSEKVPGGKKRVWNFFLSSLDILLWWLAIFGFLPLRLRNPRFFTVVVSLASGIGSEIVWYNSSRNSWIRIRFWDILLWTSSQTCHQRCFLG